ncbi:MAG: flagellar hook-length control protein FliK [Defluviitaleaceae bacterium]|nr:flagellar hook-length control protein FliK [Defluviitaleaceae bacterium]
MTSFSTSNININRLFAGVSNNGRNNPVGFVAGDVISARVAEKRNGEATLVMQNGFSFQVNSDKIIGEQGDELTFSVEKFDRDGVVLRQLGIFTSGNQIEAAVTEQTVKELFEQAGFTREIDIFDSDFLEEQAKSAEVLARVRRQISFSSANISPNVIGTLIASGISLQKINIEMLTETIREVKAIEELERGHDLVSEQKFSAISGLSGSAVMRLLKENMPLTVDNIYVAKHSAAELKNNNLISAEAWEQLEAEVSKLFEKEHIVISKEIDSLWKMMVESDVPITKENIQKALFLLNINDADLLDIKAKSDTDLFKLFSSFDPNSATDKSDIKDNAKELVELLKSVTDKHVDLVVETGLGLNFANLKALFSGTEFSSHAHKLHETEQVDSITARRQLAELQLSMTEDAARRLYGKGLDIDTLPLRRVIEELKTLETERYSALLRAAGAPDTAKNISQMDNLYSMMKESRPFTNNVFSVAVADNVDFDISSIHEAVTTARSARILSDLEAFQTVPDPKYKDSFSKVRSQLEPFVENLGIDTGEQNIKAAAILSKNEMDVTIDNIIAIKEIDAKLTYAYDRLHPSIAASMIKDGHNPAKMHIDDVVAYIDNFNGEYGQDLTERIPDYIAKMDKDKTLTSDERDAMIAVYRMLNNIQKNGAAAIGVAVKNEIDMTLGNMLEASKFFKSTYGKIDSSEYPDRLDHIVDDDFAGLDVSFDNAGSIYGAFAKTEFSKVEDYHNMITKQFADNLDPAALKELLAVKNAMDMPFDELNALLADIKSAVSDAAKLDEIMRQASENLNVTSDSVKYMVANNIPLTLANMGIIQNILKNPNYIADQLDELIDLMDSEVGEIIESSLPDSSLDAVANGEAEVLKNISSSLSRAWDESDDHEVLKKINIAQSTISLQGLMPKINELNFKLPINFGGKITGLNMYILNGNTDFSGDTSILISLKTDNLGDVGISVAIEGDSIKAAVIGENERVINFLMQEKEALEILLKDAGFTLDELKFKLKGQRETFQESVGQDIKGFISESSKYETII